jgi:hypothetical protein
MKRQRNAGAAHPDYPPIKSGVHPGYDSWGDDRK